MRNIGATDFKTHCLAILDEVARTGKAVQVLKRGKVVARLVPAVEDGEEYPQDTLAGSVETLGDLLAPVVAEHDLDALGRRKPVRAPRRKRKP